MSETKTYTVEMSGTFVGRTTIEAESLDEANKIAEELSQGEFVNDDWDIDESSRDVYES